MDLREQTCVMGPSISEKFLSLISQSFEQDSGWQAFLCVYMADPPPHTHTALHALGAHFHIHMVNPSSTSLSRSSKGPRLVLLKITNIGDMT